MYMSEADINEHWLACKVDRGMFSDEVAVTYPATEQWQKSVFVPAGFVRHIRPGEVGEVRVRVLMKDGKRYAVLPSSQRDIVKIEESDLRR
jgi:hypothetical protein